VPSRFFEIASKQLRHHTVSLLPEAVRIIRTSEAHFVENVDTDTGEITNFSTALNIIILSRFATFLTIIRKDQKLDPDATQCLMDLIDRKCEITEKDLADYKMALTDISELYKKTHPSNSRKNQIV
jgi:hypothetical protein